MNLLLASAQVALALAIAPLLNGLIKATKARFQGRAGPSLWQGYADLAKFLSRESVVSVQASWIFRAAPYLYFGALLTTAAMIPMWTAVSPLAGAADAVVLVGLMAVARFALALAALDTGSNFGGMGASREIALATLTELALFLVLFAFAIVAGSTNLTLLVGGDALKVPRLLGFAALAMIAVAETGRIPVDNPDTHLELTMIHEGMLLEYSGRPLGILLWATLVKQMVILSLITTLVAPWGIARGSDPAALAIGLATFLLKLALLGTGLAVVETSFAKLRIFRVPDFLGVAAMLGVFTLISAYLLGGA